MPEGDQETGFSSSTSFFPTCHFRREIKLRIAMEKAVFNKMETPLTGKLGVNLNKKVLQRHIRGLALCGAEEGWGNLVGNAEVLHRAKEEGNILHTIKIKKAKRIGHILRRNLLLKHVVEGKIEGRIGVTGRRGRRRKQLLDSLGKRDVGWELKDEALGRTLWRTGLGIGYGVVRQTK
jgi:hypothetical protein